MSKERIEKPRRSVLLSVLGGIGAAAVVFAVTDPGGYLGDLELRMNELMTVENHCHVNEDAESIPPITKDWPSSNKALARRLGVSNRRAAGAWPAALVCEYPADEEELLQGKVLEEDDNGQLCVGLYLNPQAQSQREFVAACVVDNTVAI